MKLTVYKGFKLWQNGTIIIEETVMTLREKISEYTGFAFIAIFALGWIDVGFGPQYTWWNLISYLAN